VCMGFVVDKTALGRVLLRVFRLSPVSITPPTIHIRLFIHFFPPMVQQPLVGQCLFIIEASRSHSGTPHSVGLPWTGDQPEAETST
jgi:hypothetical protein